MEIGQSIDEDIDLPIFDLPTITAATNGFSSENKIGAGGYGPVYKVSNFFHNSRFSIPKYKLCVHFSI